MIYLLPLKLVGLTVGLLLILGHAVAFFQEVRVKAWLKTFPRSRAMATLLIAVAAVWSFLLIRSIDLGEFSGLRQIILVAIPVGAVLSWIYVPEFLAARALGMVLLLAAEPLLESAVLRDEPSRLLLVVLAYGWVVAGLFLVGMPFLLRDAIGWVTATAMRWRLATLGGIAYGLAVLIAALFLW